MALNYPFYGSFQFKSHKIVDQILVDIEKQDKIENNKMGGALDPADEGEKQIFESVELKQRAMSQVRQSSKESIVENLKNLEIKDRLDMINFKNQFLKKVIDSNILPFHEKQVFIDELEHTEDSAIQQSKKNAI